MDSAFIVNLETVRNARLGLSLAGAVLSLTLAGAVLPSVRYNPLKAISMNLCCCNHEGLDRLCDRFRV